jgi:hypothetical protein
MERLSKREECHELGRSYVFGVMDFFKSMRYLSGAVMYEEVANAYESPHFCNIVLEDGRSIGFDILLKRFMSSHRFRFCYIECKYIGSSKTTSRAERLYHEFLGKVYESVESIVTNHRGNVDFVFVSNLPVTMPSRTLSSVEMLIHQIRNTNENISAEKVSMMVDRLKYMHIPLWVVEPYKSGGM